MSYQKIQGKRSARSVGIRGFQPGVTTNTAVCRTCTGMPVYSLGAITAAQIFANAVEDSVDIIEPE